MSVSRIVKSIFIGSCKLWVCVRTFVSFQSLWHLLSNRSSVMNRISFEKTTMEDCGSLEYTLIEAEPIIGFNLWGERRICLPQLLRFVLPDFDINVIEKAVTDLQINCFQSNFEQMHLLHMENIVPKEIVRCGLIRKSDAERLCKYLLQRNQNCDKLNDSIILSSHQFIEVVHTCFGEQRGILYPALYSTAHSKCIKCVTCDNLFKTFEFVGHTHKLDEVSNTFHWGFDSSNWRLLLQIFSDDNIMKIKKLNEAKVALDSLKTKFYEEELKEMNKSCLNTIWRPSRRLKLPNSPKYSTFSLKPPHLNYGPVEVYTKTNNGGLNNLNKNDKSSHNYVPNVYLDTKDSIVPSESVIDDDDMEEYEDLVEKPPKIQDDVALNIALKIKREVIPTDQTSLGTISTFLSKDLSCNNQTQVYSSDLKTNNSPVVVAQPHTSVPPQFLMLEALWSQLFRDIIQLTHLVQFNTNDERNRLVGQLIRCQDLFRSQWTHLAEENQGLKKTLEHEIKQRQDMETIRDKMSISFKEVVVEKEKLTEAVKQLERRYYILQNGITEPFETNSQRQCDKDQFMTKVNGARTRLKRQMNYEEDDDGSTSEEMENSSARKQRRRTSISRVDMYDMSSSDEDH